MLAGHFINTPVPPASTAWQCKPEVCVHSESPGLLAGASGPVSMLTLTNMCGTGNFFSTETED
jgi:hypothetical protein